MEAARDAVAAVSSSTPIRGMDAVEERVAASVAVPRFRTLFVTGLALMATVLAPLGVYGVVAFAVSQRTRELAVRMAIGAHPRAVIRGTLTSGMKLAAAGIVLGGTIALGVGRLLEQFLYEVDPASPLPYVVATAFVGLVAVSASWLPARRAASVDPVSVPKAE